MLSNILCLKPCPFCGGKAEVIECAGEYFVKCKKCSINQDKLYKQKCTAVNAWNRRVRNGDLHT